MFKFLKIKRWEFKILPYLGWALVLGLFSFNETHLRVCFVAGISYWIHGDGGSTSRHPLCVGLLILLEDYRPVTSFKRNISISEIKRTANFTTSPFLFIYLSQ